MLDRIQYAIEKIANSIDRKDTEAKWAALSPEEREIRRTKNKQVLMDSFKKSAAIKANPNDDKGSLPDVNYNRGYVYP